MFVHDGPQATHVVVQAPQIALPGQALVGRERGRTLGEAPKLRVESSPGGFPPRRQTGVLLLFRAQLGVRGLEGQLGAVLSIAPKVK